MNVCMVTYSFYEMDNRVRRYAETLARRGDTVEAVALRQPGQAPTEIIRGVRVRRIQLREPNEKGKWSYFIKVFLFLLSSTLYLSFRHLRRPYDFIHVHSIPDFEVFAALLPKLTGAKVILDIHDLVPELYTSKFNVSPNSWLRKLLLWIEKLSAAFSDHVIVANDIWHNTLVSRSVPASKCTAILNFPDPTIFFPRQRDARGEDRFIVLYPGTLNHHQGLDIAIRAFALVKDEIANTEFHIYGRGPDKELLRDLISELDLTDRVFLKDPLPLTQVAEVMQFSHLGVIPKRSDSFGNEAFSTKILEFMALGVPVIVADTKVDRYYFNDSVVRFFRSGDERDLAQQMLLLRHNQTLRRGLVRNADAYVRANNWDVRKAIYLDLVDSLTGNPA
jgi:glycosyltransferase involved in cell wall biosynthesis